MSATPASLFTIGHSNRTLDDFLALLVASNVQCVVDVRRLPGSRALPHFDAEPLQAALAGIDIAYWREAALCGRRTAGEVRGLPTDNFWRNASFSRYAAWTRGTEFQTALDALLVRAQAECCAVMCAEAVWWRCHRRIITDCALARGCNVWHILGPGRVVAATLTAGARTRDGHVVYAADET